LAGEDTGHGEEQIYCSLGEVIWEQINTIPAQKKKVPAQWANS